MSSVSNQQGDVLTPQKRLRLLLFPKANWNSPIESCLACHPPLFCDGPNKICSHGCVTVPSVGLRTDSGVDTGYEKTTLQVCSVRATITSQPSLLNLLFLATAMRNFNGLMLCIITLFTILISFVYVAVRSQNTA